jgi:hypothetical protein
MLDLTREQKKIQNRSRRYVFSATWLDTASLIDIYGADYQEGSRSALYH